MGIKIGFINRGEILEEQQFCMARWGHYSDFSTLALPHESCCSPILLSLVGALSVQAHAQRQALVALVHLHKRQRVARVFSFPILQSQQNHKTLRTNSEKKTNMP